MKKIFIFSLVLITFTLNFCGITAFALSSGITWNPNWRTQYNVNSTDYDVAQMEQIEIDKGYTPTTADDTKNLELETIQRSSSSSADEFVNGSGGEELEFAKLLEEGCVKATDSSVEGWLREGFGTDLSSLFDSGDITFNNDVYTVSANATQRIEKDIDGLSSAQTNQLGDISANIKNFFNDNANTLANVVVPAGVSLLTFGNTSGSTSSFTNTASVNVNVYDDPANSTHYDTLSPGETEYLNPS